MRFKVPCTSSSINPKKVKSCRPTGGIASVLKAPADFAKNKPAVAAADRLMNFLLSSINRFLLILNKCFKIGCCKLKAIFYLKTFSVRQTLVPGILLILYHRLINIQ